MQQPHRQNINENNSAQSVKPAYKKGSVKINGLVSIEPDRYGTPVVPAKPARQGLISKRHPNALMPTENGQMNAKGGGAAANANENDEIEFLLDEIKDLEVPACRTDSEQDFEIAGSRVDLDLSLQLDSPIDTSWYYSSNHSYSKLFVFSLLLLLFLFSFFRFCFRNAFHFCVGFF